MYARAYTLFTTCAYTTFTLKQNNNDKIKKIQQKLKV